jgi:Flp pilus assembly protein TadD
MADITELLPVAVRHHQAGQLAEAERIYQRILHQDPNNADALHLLGVMAHQVGRHEVAVESIGRAIAIQPREAAYHNNLGEAHRTLGRLDEAVTDRLFNPQRALRIALRWGLCQKFRALSHTFGRLLQAVSSSITPFVSGFERSPF